MKDRPSDPMASRDQLANALARLHREDQQGDQQDLDFVATA